MNLKEIGPKNNRSNQELAIPQGLIPLASGTDSQVYRDEHWLTVWKEYVGYRPIPLSTLSKYQDIIRRAQSVIPRLPIGTYQYNTIQYNIRIDAITPILAVGLDPKTHRSIAKSQYVPGPNEDKLKSIFQYQEDPFFLHQLPQEEQQRLLDFYTESQPLFDHLHRYNNMISDVLRKSVRGYPGHIIDMNVKMRMPNDKTISLTITDLCGDLTKLTPPTL